MWYWAWDRVLCAFVRRWASRAFIGKLPHIIAAAGVCAGAAALGGLWPPPAFAPPSSPPSLVPGDLPPLDFPPPWGGVPSPGGESGGFSPSITPEDFAPTTETFSPLPSLSPLDLTTAPIQVVSAPTTLAMREPTGLLVLAVGVAAVWCARNTISGKKE